MDDDLELYRREARSAIADALAAPDGGTASTSAQPGDDDRAPDLKHPDDVAGLSDAELASFGRELAIDVRGREAIRQSEATEFTDQTFDPGQRDALVNALGIHRTMIRSEGLAAYRAFWHADAAGNADLAATYRERAAGLLWAIESATGMVERLGQTPPGEPVMFSTIDVTNLFVAQQTGQRIALDHHRGFKEMRHIVDKSETLQAWDANFTKFTHDFWSNSGLLATFNPDGNTGNSGNGAY